MFHLRSMTVVQIHEVFLPSISPYDERRRTKKGRPRGGFIHKDW